MSVFQRLPIVVVQEILDHLGVSTTSDFYDNSENGAPFLSLDSVWRKEALRILCHKAKLTSSRYSHLYLRFFDIINNAGNPECNYIFDGVQCVEVRVEEADIMEGFHLADKPDAYVNTLQFANAHTVKLVIIRDDEYDSDYEADNTSVYLGETSELYNKSQKSSLRKESISNIKEFINWMARIAPNVKNVQIGFGNLDYRHKSAFENYADYVFDLLKYSSYSSLRIMHPTYNWDIEHQLSELDVYWLGNYNNCSEIIKRNAGTLKLLSLEFKGEERFDSVWDILGYQDGIVYPNVHTLHLDNRVYEWVNSKPSGDIDSDYAPFPALRYLKTSRNYAITDDVLFRGNEKTLERINVSVHKEWLHILKDIFTHRSCDQIKSMRFKLKPFKYFGNELCEEPAFEDFIKALPSSLVKLCFKANPTPACLLSAEQYSRFAQLQLLKFERTGLMLETVCQIVSASPWLREIHGKNYFLDSHLKKESIDEIADILSTKYSLADARLSSANATQFANHISYNPFPKTNIAMCSAVLAKLCPQFKQISVGSNHQKTIYVDLENDVSSPGGFPFGF